jgi:hypothetical protein
VRTTRKVSRGLESERKRPRRRRRDDGGAAADAVVRREEASGGSSVGPDCVSGAGVARSRRLHLRFASSCSNLEGVDAPWPSSCVLDVEGDASFAPTTSLVLFPKSAFDVPNRLRRKLSAQKSCPESIGEECLDCIPIAVLRWVLEEMNRVVRRRAGSLRQRRLEQCEQIFPAWNKLNGLNGPREEFIVCATRDSSRA